MTPEDMMASAIFGTLAGRIAVTSLDTSLHLLILSVVRIGTAVHVRVQGTHGIRHFKITVKEER